MSSKVIVAYPVRRSWLERYGVLVPLHVTVDVARQPYAKCNQLES